MDIKVMLFYEYEMSTKRLTRAQREQIIIDYIKGNPTPGFEVKENPTNGKFSVKAIKEPPKQEESVESIPKFELEEEDINESTIDNKPIPRNKQDARELLRQLSELLIEDEEVKTNPQQGQYIEKRYKPGPQSWVRKKLVL